MSGCNARLRTQLRATRTSGRGDHTLRTAFGHRVVELRGKLTGSLKLLGSHATLSAEHPNIWLCEADDWADLQFTNN